MGQQSPKRRDAVKCIICERRPAVNGSGYCANCAAKIEAERRLRKPEQPDFYLTYKGHVVGLFPNGDGKWSARLLQRNAERLPKRKTINLNCYCQGYKRDQIKRFKATVLRLANG